MRQLPGEHALLKRARQYDEAALGELYDHYAPRIYAYIYGQVSDPHLAEDLVGDVFVRVVQAIRSERFWHTSFNAWLRRIAHNTMVDHYRQRSPILSDRMDEIWVSGKESDPRSVVETAQDYERLRRAMRCLTRGQQEVLVLRFGQGLTARETAQVLRKTTGSVKAMQHRAVLALRRRLAKSALAQGRAAANGRTTWGT
ncbi:MAG: sigma-70 family RNA polymerase sigma factor [Anaerolineae bacterium]